MDTEHKELAVPETPKFEVDFSSTSTPIEDYQRALELAHKYALKPSMKRITHAIYDDEYLNLVSKQKKHVQEGPSLHARAVNPDGNVYKLSKATSNVATNVYDESKNQTSIENRTSTYPQTADPVKQIGLNEIFKTLLSKQKKTMFIYWLTKLNIQSLKTRWKQ
ncbi:hypothetical protein CANINC_002490 [Pichia inconspicua]|uniref:Uncharacterized protein n=1 Tax=Pichia inconspicua TaxID=52247 RepID=A0A4T0X113_9ASCO|nr:hypothetical protein CANINC_002490 [[Candida] inconspicua]